MKPTPEAYKARNITQAPVSAGIARFLKDNGITTIDELLKAPDLIGDVDISHYKKETMRWLEVLE